MTRTRLGDISPFQTESEHVNVIVETPKGCRNKFDYDEELELFKLAGVLPAGAVFPFDFGFVPSTVGGDDDPLDVLLLMDEPAFPGCLVEARLIGVIEAEQTEADGETLRNDRLIAVAANSRTHEQVRSLKALNPTMLEEIEHFFVSYNVVKGKEFRPLGRFGPARARALVEEGNKLYRKKKSRRPARVSARTTKRRPKK
jgi:inorganic pyrophosphatase